MAVLHQRNASTAAVHLKHSQPFVSKYVRLLSRGRKCGGSGPHARSAASGAAAAAGAAATAPPPQTCRQVRATSGRLHHFAALWQVRHRLRCMGDIARSSC